MDYSLSNILLSATSSLLVDIILPCRGKRLERETRLITKLLFYFRHKNPSGKAVESSGPNKHVIYSFLRLLILISLSFSHSYSIIANSGSLSERADSLLLILCNIIRCQKKILLFLKAIKKENTISLVLAVLFITGNLN